MFYFISFLFFIAGVTACFIYLKLKNKKENITADVPVILNLQHNLDLEEKEKSIPEVKTEKIQRQLNNLFLVNELSQHITGSLSVEESFSHLYNTINSMMDASVVELLVYGDDEKRLFFSNKKYPGSTTELSRHNHMSEWCLKNDKEIYLEDAETDYGRYVFKPLTLPDGKTARSLMAFPINYHDKLTGTLCIISFTKNAFELFHKEMIRLLLPFIGVAINNASSHQQIIDLKQRAERSEKFMQQFLANMSHEIRTPIHAVTGMTRLLLEKGPKQEQLKYLESIRNASDSLLVIINDILDLSKIEAGKIEFEKIDFSVLDTVENVMEIMQFKAEEKGLLLETQFDDKVPPVLIGDPTRLTQVLINLVGNAVKFTDRGSVKLSVTNIELAPKNNLAASICTLGFNISDTGIGMTEEQQGKLFQNYAQASTDTSRKYGGTGLGLSISKQLVELLQGTIEVISAPGAGSTFSFTLSYQVSENKTMVRKEKAVSNEMLGQLKGIKILLADDNEYNRIVAKETLQLKIENVVVEEAMDGAMAVEMVRDHEYDIVIMDLVMPKMNGLEATFEIRNRLPVPKNQIKIVALTASVVKSEIDQCFAAGMNGFIPKPFKSYELLGVIYTVFRSEEEVVFEIPSLKNRALQLPGMLVDLDYLRDFTEGDMERLQRYVDLFLEKIPESMASLNAALDKNEFEKMRIASHSLKPLLQATGVLTGLAIAEKIEQTCTEKTNLEQLPVLIKQLNKICDSALEEMKAINISQMK